MHAATLSPPSLSPPYPLPLSPLSSLFLSPLPPPPPSPNPPSPHHSPRAQRSYNDRILEVQEENARLHQSLQRAQHASQQEEAAMQGRLQAVRDECERNMKEVKDAKDLLQEQLRRAGIVSKEAAIKHEHEVCVYVCMHEHEVPSVIVPSLHASPSPPPSFHPPERRLGDERSTMRKLGVRLTGTAVLGLCA